MNKKALTHILITILVVNVFARLWYIPMYTTRLLNLLSDNILSGDLFEAHIFSHRSSYFWFNLIDSSIPHIIVLTTLVGVFNYFRNAEITINRYLVLGVILAYFPTLPEIIILSTGMTKYSLEQYLQYDSVWPWVAIVLHVVGFIYVAVYFSKFNAMNLENQNVSGDLKIRFKNYFIDTTYLVYLTLRLFQLFAGIEEIYLFAVYAFTSLLYYLYSESLFSQSLGKIATNTFVDFNGNRLTGCIVRTVARRIPLEPFSFFLKESYGRWHDKLSNSRLVSR